MAKKPIEPTPMPPPDEPVVEAAHVPAAEPTAPPAAELAPRPVNSRTALEQEAGRKAVAYYTERDRKRAEAQAAEEAAAKKE